MVLPRLSTKGLVFLSTNNVEPNSPSCIEKVVVIAVYNVVVVQQILLILHDIYSHRDDVASKFCRNHTRTFGYRTPSMKNMEMQPLFFN
jgi:hypothetical protein